MSVGGDVPTKIFDDDDEEPNKKRTEDYAKEIEKRRQAESERYKGNDYMKSKEF